jgi:ribosomal protein S18 acetylase RimI-like enzyme
MSSLLQVRTAAARDIPAIIELFGVVDDVHTAGVPYAFRGASAAPRSSTEVEALIVGPDTTLLVAVAGAGGRLRGQVVVELITMPDRMPFVPRKYGLVRDLVVAAGARRQGVGRALMTAAEEWSAERGADSVELTVWSFNEGAKQMYEQMGYTTAHRRMRRVIR